MKGDFVVAIDCDLGEVSVPALARIDPQLLAGPAGERVPGAFDVLRRKRLAVVPLDTRAQPKRERGLVLVPGCCRSACARRRQAFARSPGPPRIPQRATRPPSNMLETSASSAFTCLPRLVPLVACPPKLSPNRPKRLPGSPPQSG